MANNIAYVNAIWEITNALQNMPTIEEALAFSLKKAAAVTGAQTGTIWFYDRHGSDTIYPAYVLGNTMPKDMTLRPGEGVAGAVIAGGKSELVANAAEDPRWAGRVDEQTGFVTRSIISAPLRNQYEIIGCIQLINKIDGAFDEEDLKLAENLASLAAIAIEAKGLIIRYEPEKPAVVSMKDLTKEYFTGQGVLQILKGITLDIYENEFVAVLGASGCGKTTLLNIIGGMDAASSGSLTVNGLDLTNCPYSRLTNYRRHDVGFIFQAYHLMPNISAKENLDLIAELSADSMDTMEALDIVSMRERANHYPSQLSGGQQQRVSIARAIVKRPKLILADEPTAALDYNTGIEVLEVFEDIVQRKISTLILVTHNAEIAKMANRIISISDGQITGITKNAHPLKARELKW